MLYGAAKLRLKRLSTKKNTITSLVKIEFLLNSFFISEKHFIFGAL